LKNEKETTDIISNDGAKELFKYPILETIARRRSRRFPIGCTMDFGALKYASKHEPVPLSDLELAILCWSGAGVTGTVTVEDLAGTGQEIPSWVGRAAPSGHNAHLTKLFFTCDSGTFVYDPTTASKTVEIDTEADRQKIVTYFEKDCRKITDSRLQMYSEFVFPTLVWNTNQPGTTVFIPVVDVVEPYLGSVMNALVRSGYQIFDDMKGNRSAGLQKFIDSGDLKGPPVSLTSFEKILQRGIFTAPCYMMLEHIHLVAEAMGLGSVIFAGYTGEVMLGITPMGKGLGFRAVEDKEGNLNPVGLDGVFEAYCPPFYKSMDDAIDALFKKMFGSTCTWGCDYDGVLPFDKRFWEKIRPAIHRPTERQTDMIKSFCNYVYDTYGRIPATANAKSIPIWLQVHHLDIDFYETYYAAGMVTKAQKDHMKIWHRE
jgi:hypothetical protein